MGRIILETGSAKFELERSDEEVFKCLQELTGISVAMKDSHKETPDIAEVGPEDEGTAPFSRDTLPSREDLIEYVLEHLDGFNIPMSLEHFFGCTPKYGITKEQNTLLGTYSSRLLRARRAVEQLKDGEFEEETIRGQKLFVFKPISSPDEGDIEDPIAQKGIQNDNQEHLFEEEKSF
jgi:hypothetical protein